MVLNVKAYICNTNISFCIGIFCILKVERIIEYVKIDISIGTNG